jgi:hypothetical protein
MKLKSCVTKLLETLDETTESIDETTETTETTEALNRGFYAVIVFLDIAKAFDKVIHSL